MTDVLRAWYPPLPPGGLRGDGKTLAVARFLARVGGAAFRSGPLGMELSRVDCASRGFSFRDVETPDPRLPVFPLGPVPEEDCARNEWVWMPAPPSPPWAHLAWLVTDLGDQYGMLGEHGVELLGVDAPSRSRADLLVAHAGARRRVRVALEGRTEPIENAAMFVGELFGEGRHTRYAADGAGDLVDVSGVL
ncbi:hypothetical protein [Streptomyces sp. NPDC014894]|uniref:hypothetical protein n=1 Tax=unclassified Streptomyces TaxID=2593676 RepID=UPI0036FAC32C